MNRRHALETALLLGLVAILGIALLPAASGGQVEVYGQVIDSSNDHDVQDARVHIYDVGGERTWTEETDSDGFFFRTLETGNYVLSITHDNYNTSYYWVEVPEEHEGLLDLGSFEITPLREAVATVSGNVTDSSTGAPIKGADTYLYDDGLDVLIGPDRTNKQGNYSLEYAEGSWSLVVDAEGYVLRWVDVTLNASNGTIMNVVLDPLPDGHWIRGKVKDSSTEQGIPDATITLRINNLTLWEDDDFAPITSTTNLIGYSSIHNVTEGAYTLVIDAPGYEAYIDRAFVVGGDRYFGATDTIYLDPTPTGEAVVDVVFEEDWNATASIRENIVEDLALWNYSWDLELYDLFHTHGFGRVGPDAIAGTGLGDGQLDAAEFRLVEVLYDYYGVPERYGSLVTVNNGSAIGYDAVLTGSDVDNAEWWATWEIALTRTGTFENVYLTVESELNYDDDRTYVYAFDLPDGWAPIRTENTDFLLEFMENGYNVSEGNGTGMGTVAVDVSNDDAAPVATFTVDNMVNGTVNESVAVELNATLSGDTGTNQSGIVMYVWDFGDGEMANLTGPETSHTYDIPGEYEIVLRVVDRANRTSAGHTMLLTVADITPPEVTLWFPEVVDVEGRGEVINLTGPNGVNATIVVNVTDADAVDTGYAVLLQVRAKDIEDANWTNQSWEAAVTAGENLTHTFHQILLTPGNQTVRVTVTDDAGNEATATGSILVWDMIPPVAEITVEDATLNAINLTELKENEEFVFNASGSTDNSRLLMVLWEFGDGTVDEDKNDKTDIGDLNEIVKHVYHAPGIYQVNATVVDDWGNSAEATVNVSVLDNVAPEAKFTTWVNGSQGSHVHEETEMIVFNATESSDTSGVIAYYSWDFGDNVTVNGTEAVVNHTYQDPGTMTVNLTIGDGAGHWDRISKTVTVVALDKPDFTVDIQEDEIDTNIKEGDRARIVVKVFNKGEVDLADGETVKVALLVVRTVPVEKTEDNSTIVVSEERTEEVASELIDGLAVNENKTVVLTWKPKHGSYRLRVIVDPDNGWDELKTDGVSGEDNNQEEISLRVGEPEEDNITLYIAGGAVGALAIFGLLMWKKHKLSSMEERLRGRKKGKKRETAKKGEGKKKSKR